MKASYSRLQLKVSGPLKFQDLTFKFTVHNLSSSKRTEFEGRFDGQGFTQWYQIYNLNTLLSYKVYIRGELLQTILVKAYPDKKKWSLFTIKMTTEKTQKVKNNIREIYLNDGEVAWYLIKKTETMLDWSKRVFQKPLVASDWDMLRANNPHISNIAAIRLLTPGMVVVLSNSTTAKKLPQYKKDAQEAQRNLDEMKKDKDFDAEFFAQNYEFFYDALNDNRTEITRTNVFANNDHPLVQPFNHPGNDSGAAWGAITKGGIDGVLNFSDGATKRIYKIHGELAQKLAEEKAKGSGLANPKNFKEFRRKYAHLYDQLDRESAKKLFKWDQSIKTSNMRRMISQSTLARGTTYKGGMKEYVKKMSEIGKMSKVVKGGGYLFLALDIYNAGDAIAHAKPGEKARTTVVESSKIVGGLGGAALGSFIVLTVATGGTSLLVLGVAAGTSALLGWGFSEGAGQLTEYIYDKVSK
ncbi:hypothetical protein [Acinetobacter sp. WZC-1]|uniref:hypothetical protein n=1 Tax=Acinetobacter sp. WZC-1 TaxID=3459034 RepID=UPI00403D8845